jgi:hypothetical protein
MTGLGLRRKTVENLALELPDNATKYALARLCGVQEIQDQFLSRQYRYKVSNEIRLVSMKVDTFRHI